MQSDGWFTLAEIKREHIQMTLDTFNWRMTHCAKLLGVDRRSLYRMIQVLGITRPIKTDALKKWEGQSIRQSEIHVDSADSSQSNTELESSE